MIAKTIVVSLIILFDIFILAWLVDIPILYKEYGIQTMNQWKQLGYFQCLADCIFNAETRKLYLILQVIIVACIFGIIFWTNQLKISNNGLSELGTPIVAGNGQFGTARWQTEKEKYKSCLLWDGKTNLEYGGLVLGKKDDFVCINKSGTHNLILGGTGSGKTRKIILPSIWAMMSAGESMVLGDPKGELFISTKNALEKNGYKVFSVNFREPLKSDKWNLLDPVINAVKKGDISYAERMAASIAETLIKPGAGQKSSEPIWEDGAKATIRALIMLVVMEADFDSQKTMASVYTVLAEMGGVYVEEESILTQYIDTLPINHPARKNWALLKLSPARTKGSFFAQVLAALSLFAADDIADLTSEQSHVLANVGVEKTAVFLIVPDEESTYNKMATIYISQLYQELVRKANDFGGKLPKNVNIILDEFGNIPAIPDFSTIITVARSRGIRLTIVLQSLKQLKKLYGDDNETIAENCKTWIYIKTNSRTSAEEFSKRIGKYTVHTESSNSSMQSHSHSVSAGVNLTARDLLTPDEVLRWGNEKNRIIVVREAQYPAYYEAPDLSNYEANSVFGFKNMTEKECVKEIEKRWNSIKAREPKKVCYWLPYEVPCKHNTESDIENPTQDIL